MASMVKITYRNKLLEPVNEEYYTLEDYTAMLRVGILGILSDVENLVYAMNGQSGKIYGDLPVDKKKLFWWSAIYALIAFIIVFLIGGLF